MAIDQDRTVRTGRNGRAGSSAPTAAWAQPWYSQLTRNAKALTTKSPEVAVLTAQMACESYAERAFAALLRHHNMRQLAGPVRRLIPSYDLRASETRRLWTALTGDRLEQADPEWRHYLRHLERRDAIVHRGLSVATPEADESVYAAVGLIVHLQHVTDDALRRPAGFAR